MTCHSEERPRRKTLEDEVLRDASEEYRGRNYTDSSFASLRCIPQNDIFIYFSKLFTGCCPNQNKVSNRKKLSITKCLALVTY
jgi:hypothetical protein